MIIEGLLTTVDAGGSPHVAPMGPLVNPELTSWTLRPFQSSTTYQLLRENATCVFHVVDDVVPIVQAALGQPVSVEYTSHTQGGWIISSSCHWYRLQVTRWDASEQRSRAEAEVTDQGVLRPFWGWNRAKHAILEATILATRLHLADRAAIDEDLSKLEVAITKTAGPREQQAWRLLQDYFASH